MSFFLSGFCYCYARICNHGYTLTSLYTYTYSKFFINILALFNLLIKYHLYAYLDTNLVIMYYVAFFNKSRSSPNNSSLLTYIKVCVMRYILKWECFYIYI
jgi:hypothetical protein